MKKNVNNRYSGKDRLEILKLRKVFAKYANNFEYRKGIRKIEAMIEKNSNAAQEEALISLATLYDHLAMQETSQKKQLEKEAIRIYRMVLKRNPASYRATWGIGRIFWHDKDSKALKYALKAYRLREKDGKGTGLYPQHVGLVYQSMGDLKKAEQWLKKGVEENPEEWDGILNLATFYHAIGNKKKGTIYKKLLKRKIVKHEGEEFFKSKWGKKIMNFISE